MMVYRSQYWYKNKTWFADLIYRGDDWRNCVRAEERIIFDIKEFAKQTGVKIGRVRNMFNLAIHNGGIHSSKNPLEDIAYNKFGFTMRDLGLIESKEFLELVVMS